MKYFAYGSNMCLNRLKERVPSSTFFSVGMLKGYELKWHKISDDGSGKCNAYKTNNAKNEIIGVIFDFNDNDKHLLDDSEKGYDCEIEEIVLSEGSVRAHLYIAQPIKINDSLKPYTWYKDVVVFGAQQFALPQKYINKLLSIEAHKDPNEERELNERKRFLP